MYMTVGSGVVWDDVLPLLKEKGLSAVHGQCTSVGVAGYSLHGMNDGLHNQYDFPTSSFFLILFIII